MNIKKLFVGALATLTLVACGTIQQKESKVETVKVGVVGSVFKELWEYVGEKAKKENINIEVVELNDYVQPNRQLADGEIQMNSFQHRAYLEKFNEEHKTDIVEIGTTFITPLYFYSNKYKSLTDLPQNATVAIPKETAIQGRALIALQTAGVLKLKEGSTTTSGLDAVVENPKNLNLLEVESAQAARILEDVDAATINGTFAGDAGIPIEKRIFSDVDYIDTIPTDRYNIIAVNAKDKDNATYKKIVELFQTDDVSQKIEELAPGQFFPVWKK